LGYLEKFETL